MVALDPDLREADVGLLEGLSFDEAAARFPALAEQLLARRIDLDWPGGERASDVLARAGRAWQHLRQAADTGAEVVAVSHGWLIAVLVSLATGDEGPVVLAPAGTIHLICRQGRWLVDTPAATAARVGGE
jgi:probable phosphoglycerate mutase